MDPNYFQTFDGSPYDPYHNDTAGEYYQMMHSNDVDSSEEDAINYRLQCLQYQHYKQNDTIRELQEEVAQLKASHLRMKKTYAEKAMTYEQEKSNMVEVLHDVIHSLNSANIPLVSRRTNLPAEISLSIRDQPSTSNANAASDLSEIERPEISSSDEPPKVFLLCGFTLRKYEKYNSLIKQLGGTVCEPATPTSFNASCTHVVMPCDPIIRSDITRKIFYCAIASGKLVLSADYLERTQADGCFADEEIYKYGNPKGLDDVNDYMDMDRSIAKAAYRQHKNETRPLQDNFYYIIEDTDKRLYSDILKAGGGNSTTIDARQGYREIHQQLGTPLVDFILVDKKSFSKGGVANTVVKRLEQEGHTCVKAEYLLALLVEESPFTYEDFLFGEDRFKLEELCSNST